MIDSSNSSQLGPPYPFPPITEAVVEFRFEDVLDEAKQVKLSEKLAKHYPNQSVNVVKGVKVDLASSKVEFQDGDKSYRRSNNDENEIVIIGSQGLVISQLASYPSWDHFYRRIRRDREIAQKVLGYCKLRQIGVRYINRIDVPIDEDGLARHEDYLRLQIQLPPEYPDNIGYALSVQLPLQELKSVANINSGAVSSPMPNFASFTLDIDVVRVVDVPQRDDDIYELLSDMRKEKNKLFESFITDLARERFFYDHILQ